MPKNKQLDFFDLETPVSDKRLSSNDRIPANLAGDGGLIPTQSLQFTIRQIPQQQTYEWLLKKHYAHRIPNICYAFGLYDSNKYIQGVCTFGTGGNINNNYIGDYDVIELNRLVVNDNLGKNALSFFVSHCLKYLPKPKIVVSYADANRNHHGYIYQALNFMYTGLSSSENIFIINEKEIHRKTFYEWHGTSSEGKLLEIYGDKLTIVEGLPKYRYFYIVANKQQKKDILKIFPYKIQPYPKGNNQSYDASYEPTRQGLLF